ncbi:hypothetical protein ACHQM5_026814 [Ranunculus cassubicifolius]
MACCSTLKNKLQHIGAILEKQMSAQVARNRLRVKTTLDVVRWLTFQGCAFRGRDEGIDSSNRGNVIEMIKLLASYNNEVAATVLENAPHNATYSSPMSQKELLHVLADKTQEYIRQEISDGKFCILVDESRDESKREQMVIVLRFVDKDGFVQERFFDIVLSRHNLSVQNIRGQGYDGASNMRGQWSGLQALFSADCSYAYYIHCFAHQKSVIYPLIDRLIRLVLTLPVSTATSERAFSAMKIVKTRLRNRMEDDFLSCYLITLIEKDIAQRFDADSIIDAFDLMGNRRAQLRMPKFVQN